MKAKCNLFRCNQRKKEIGLENGLGHYKDNLIIGKMKNTAASARRVRENTPSKLNRQIDQLTSDNVKHFSKTNQDITGQIVKLDREWDIERTLEVNMSTVALTGIALSVFVNKKWLILPTVVLGFFVQHALQGWCPPLPIFRALKVRTRAEIDQEKYALKALRGDFEHVTTPDEALQAAKKQW